MSVSVFSYTNYCAFLLDIFTDRKRHQPGWSIRAWAKQLHMASPSMLTMILKGTRNPGSDLSMKLSRQLGLNEKEESYFLDLVELQKANGDDRKSVWIMERLAQQRPNGEFRQLSRDAFLAISRWHYYAVREIVSLSSFREDAEWIARQLQFRVSPSEVKDAIRTLIKVGLLARDANGVLRQASGHVETTSDVADEGIKRFHEQALENARLSLRKHEPQQREFRATTFAMPQRKVAQAKSLIRKFHQDFCRLLEEDATDSVYQLEIGFYPVAIEEKK